MGPWVFNYYFVLRRTACVPNFKRIRVNPWDDKTVGKTLSAVVETRTNETHRNTESNKCNNVQLLTYLNLDFGKSGDRVQ